MAPENFEKISPFVISKLLYGLVGDVQSVRKIKDGLLVQTKSNPQSKRLMEVTKFGEYEVEIIPHATLNQSKGVILCRDLLNSSVEEVKEELKSIGVIHVRRLKTKRNNFKIPDRPIFYTSRERSESMSTNISTVSEQKKRQIESTSEDDDPKKGKRKKRGWPKGQSRKQVESSTSDVISNL
nr:unnamed protein product [Callosobruchus chinensis]